MKINGEVGAKLRNFSDFALENINLDDQNFPYGFLLELDIIVEGDEVAVFEAFSKAEFYYEEPFDVPGAPEKPEIYDLSYDHSKFMVTKHNANTTGLRFAVTDLMNNEVTLQTFCTSHFVFDIIMYQTVPQTDVTWSQNGESSETVEVEVSDLTYATVYSLTAQYLTRHGRGPKSQTSDLFVTAPTSPPLELTVAELTANSITVTWDAPQFIGEGLDNLKYNVVLEGMSFM